MMTDSKIPLMVMIPTYNESKNILLLIEKLLSVDPSLHVVVVDDDSPDGTWRMVKEASEKDQRIHLIHRIGKKGRGSAGIEGFQYAIAKEAGVIVEMDSDFSHNPAYIASFLKEIGNVDMVIGSRAVEGGGETGRGVLRKWITFGANLYIRVILGLKVKDCTSGYRMFRRKVLEGVNLESLISNGPSIVQEILYKAHLKRFSMKEVPILFEERAAGQSTFSVKIMLNSLYMVPKFRFIYRSYAQKTAL
ncbi:MAG: polyprenol monophosphomannose synthase [Nitrospirae bacterium]|nr:polyprenol monophosphomannose synthase [Nitrospirota bacterium]